MESKENEWSGRGGGWIENFFHPVLQRHFRGDLRCHGFREAAAQRPPPRQSPLA